MQNIQLLREKILASLRESSGNVSTETVIGELQLGLLLMILEELRVLNGRRAL